MVVDITSVSVLENMYNILTELKKNIVIPLFFQSRYRGQQSIGVVSSKITYSSWAQRRKKLLSKDNQKLKLNPTYIKINQESSPRF